MMVALGFREEHVYSLALRQGSGGRRLEGAECEVEGKVERVDSSGEWGYGSVFVNFHRIPSTCRRQIRH